MKRRSFTLNDRSLEAINVWMQRHGCRSASEALREMIQMSIRLDEFGETLAQHGRDIQDLRRDAERWMKDVDPACRVN